MPSSSGQDKPPRFGKLAVAPAYRVVFETIEREILAGRLAPGTRLPSETALAEQFGVNRSTAREGLRLLEQTGLVDRRAGRRLHAAVPRTTIWRRGPAGRCASGR